MSNPANLFGGGAWGRRSVLDNKSEPKAAPAFCQSYDEARQIYLEGELQAWDGDKWEDIPADSQPFFSRRVEEYRRRPAGKKPILTPTHGAALIVHRRLANGNDVELSFSTASEFANWVWGKDLDYVQVFKRVDLTELDLRKMAAEIEAA